MLAIAIKTNLVYQHFLVKSSKTMNWNFSRPPFLPAFFTGTVTVAAIVISQATASFAKSSQEIGQIATATTVQINSNAPGSIGGSGAIVYRQGKTYIVFTASHVVCSRNVANGPCRTDIKHTIRTNKDKEYPTTSIQTVKNAAGDPDLAVVTFESNDEYPIAKVGNSETSIVGTEIYVAGFPGTPERKGAQRILELTQGIISSRLPSANNGYTMRYTANTLKGMSGGPVFDSSGRLIGIHGQGESQGSVTIVNDNGDAQEAFKTGWNSAIPINTLMAMRSKITALADIPVDSSAPPDTRSIDNPIEAVDYLNRGNIKYDDKQYSLAIVEYNQAIQMQPDFVDAYNNRAMAQLKLRKYTEAIADANEVIKLNPSNNRELIKAYFNRAFAYTKQHNREAAIADYNQVLKLDPQDSSAYAYRGDLKSESGDTQGAIDDYNLAIKNNPNHAYAYFNRAIIRYENLKDKPGAIQDFEVAAQIFSDSGDMYSYQVTEDNLRMLKKSRS